ncbi:hypothetical protein [Pedobacter jejuensis]|uniref:HTH cro/C1-type domain-containing protein n=1 Tax=Pedobacter jejuensis TaxID=1268550 RepID=A0A3N0BXR8_9SPHI|nr:hypothetical protein [Pedobacter jejuensis]RNL54541.1 hypothetical protein D7004_07035 [Pedobacter jejuensis]
MKTKKADLGVAQRFKEFRKEFVANNMIEAEPLLNLAKSQISRIERGEEPITVATIKLLVINYDLNRDWLLDNQGNKQKKDLSKKTGLATMNEMGDRIDTLSNEISILKQNLKKAWEIIERHDSEIDKLQEKF